MIFIKICGITRRREAQAAAAAGADALGFVFAPSPRRVSLDKAAEIADGIQAPARKIGVFVDAPLETISAHVARLGLDGVQLHGSEGPGYIRRVKASCPGTLVFKAVRMNGKDSSAAAVQFLGEADAVMLDPKDAAHPDRAESPLPLEWMTDLPPGNYIIAGGLDPENVGDVVAALQPWGVDASRGLEIRPGLKDPAKIRAFVRAVRETE